MRKILITISNLSVSAELNNSVSADKIWEALPLSGSANVWGDEIYFKIPKINLNIEDNAKDIVNLGEIAFWIEGNSIAIGFGRTPISQLDEIRLAAKVNIWADAENPEQVKLLSKINDGEEISINVKK